MLHSKIRILMLRNFPTKIPEHRIQKFTNILSDLNQSQIVATINLLQRINLWKINLKLSLELRN